MRLTPPLRERQIAILVVTLLGCLLLYACLDRLVPITPAQAFVIFSPPVACAMILAFYTWDGRHLSFRVLRASRHARRSSSITRRKRHFGRGFGDRLMPHEPPLIVAILALLAALGLLLPVAAGRAPSDPVRVPAPAESRPDTDHQRITADRHRGQEPPAAAHEGSAHPRTPECPLPEAVAFPEGAAVAVSADAAGRFRLYGLPDPQTGLEGTDSHDLLRGCGFAGTAVVQLNPVRVALGSAEHDVELGPETLVAETREYSAGANRALTTAYRIPGGLFVTQTLAVVRVEGRFASSRAPDTLRASYRLENVTGRSFTADLSTVLTPASGPGTNEHSGVPYFANHPADGPRPMGADPVSSATVLSAGRSEMPKEIIVPRPGAAASATSYWRPVGAAPTRLVFGPAGNLALGSVLPIDAGGSLTDSSAFAALWEDVAIPARGSRTLSYEYGQTSGWPGR